jgi:hypothetical protein
MTDIPAPIDAQQADQDRSGKARPPTADDQLLGIGQAEGAPDGPDQRIEQPDEPILPAEVAVPEARRTVRMRALAG